MAAGFPIEVEGVKIRTSEALYQAMRYPKNPEFQHEIIQQRSPMTAKMISKKYHSHTRSDWEEVKLVIMRWCLRVKLIENWDKFGSLLLSTSDKSIVEESRKDEFWGAKPLDVSLLVGTNALGRLLMELRTELPNFIGKHELSKPPIRNFKLYDTEISAINFENTNMPIDSTLNLITYDNLSLFDK